MAAVVTHPLLVGAIAAAAWLATAARGIVATKRRQQLIDRELPDALDIFALLLAAGSTPRQAVTELSQRGPLSTRPAFASVVTRLETGAAFADAITELRATLGHRATALVDLLTAAERSGLPMAQVVLQLSSESRATRRRLDEAAARALPIKLSFPLVVCTLPSFVMLAIVPAVVAALSSLGSDAW